MKEYNFTEKKDTRSGFGDGLLEVGCKNPQVVALAADLSGSVKMSAFRSEERRVGKECRSRWSPYH